VRPAWSSSWTRASFAIFVLIAAAAILATAQFNGRPPSTTTIGGHSLAPPPSVTSIGGRHLPPPAPSVTSLPNFGFHNHGPYFNGRYAGHGYLGGWAYAVPYYYPLDNSAYGYDYVGAGPDLYAGPPPGPDDPTLHVIVEQPPASRYGADMPEPQAYAPPAPPQPASAPVADVKPGEPVVLVFHNGRKQEVTNYAIMGDSLYVFDQGRKKIALADLDIPATVKANDDRGQEFRMPPAPSKKKTSTAVPQSVPDQKPDKSAGSPPNVATLMP